MDETKSRGLEDETGFKHKGNKGHEAIPCSKLRVLCSLRSLCVKKRAIRSHHWLYNIEFKTQRVDDAQKQPYAWFDKPMFDF